VPVKPFYCPTKRPALVACAALLALAPYAYAQAPAPAAGPSLTPLLTGLALVLGLIGAAAWLLRRAGLAQNVSSSGLRVVGQLALGPRERLVVIEVGDRRWLLGVSAAGIARLGTLPAGSEGGAPSAPAAERSSFADVIRRLTSPR
jgi:flagellar protein FliO/FliZ